MSRLPVFTARELIARLRKAGFQFDRHAKGSHGNPGHNIITGRSALSLVSPVVAWQDDTSGNPEIYVKQGP